MELVIALIIACVSVFLSAYKLRRDIRELERRKRREMRALYDRHNEEVDAMYRSIGRNPPPHKPYPPEALE